MFVQYFEGLKPLHSYIVFCPFTYPFPILNFICKGGVGKSLVATLLSIALARQGKEVGILDADITGPSIPKMFGLSGARPSGSDTGMLPVLSKLGIGTPSS